MFYQTRNKQARNLGPREKGLEVGRKQTQAMKFLSIFLLCSLLTIACGQRREAPKTSNTPSTTISNMDPGIISIGTTLKTRTVDPADAYEISSGNLLYNLGDRLYAYASGTTNLEPQLATAFPKVSSDGLTYTIPLRQGVVFHDDTPFNAEAMVFSLKRFISNGGRPSFLLADLIASVNATQEYELTIKLKKPFAAFPSLLAFSGACAVSPKAYEIGQGKFKPNTFVGTGPYKLVAYGTDTLRLEAFSKYWGQKPANSGIAFQIFSSAANLFNAFRTGAIDVAYLSLDSQQISSLKNDAAKGNWQVIAANGNTVNYMVLNLKSEPLNKLEVRQALATVINRKLITDRVLEGQGEPLYSLLPKNFAAYQPVFQKFYGDNDIPKAKELLNKAGFSASNPAKIQLWYSSSSTKKGLIANTIKAAVEKELEGIMQLELNSVESTTAFQNIEKGIYPTFLLDWYADFFDPDNYIQPFLECPKAAANLCESGASQSQGSFYYNPKVNQLIDQQRRELNPQKRQAIFQELQVILGQDVPYIPLWVDQDFIFAKKGVNGVKLEPSQQFAFWGISK